MKRLGPMLKVSFPRPAASSAILADVPRGRLPAGTHSVRLCLGIGGIRALVFPRARTFDVRCPGVRGTRRPPCRYRSSPLPLRLLAFFFHPSPQ